MPSFYCIFLEKDFYYNAVLLFYLSNHSQINFIAAHLKNHTVLAMQHIEVLLAVLQGINV